MTFGVEKKKKKKVEWRIRGSVIIKVLEKVFHGASCNYRRNHCVKKWRWVMAVCLLGLIAISKLPANGMRSVSFR